MPPVLDGVELESRHGLEGPSIVEHPRVTDGVRFIDSISSSGTAAQSQELSPGWTIASPELKLFLPRGDVGVALGYDNFLRGLEDHKALPLKEWRPCLKNEVFRVSIVAPLS